MLFNIILAFTGLVMTENAETKTQDTIGTVCLGVGLARMLNGGS